LYAYLCVFAHSRFVENPPIWSWETNPSFLRWFCHRLLLITVGSWSLGKFLGLGRGITWGSTDILMMLWTTLITMSHCLQEGIPNMSEYKAWVLKITCKSPMRNPWEINTQQSEWSWEAGYVHLVQTCPATGWICPVRTDPLGKMSINHVLLVETLSN
jgi:hypothetical protein